MKGKKMSFDIKAHLTGHADFVLHKKKIFSINNNNEEIEKPDLFENNSETDNEFKNKNYLHFKLSFSAEQFKDKEEAQKKLLIILNELKNCEFEVNEKNGVRKNKNGTVKQKYRKRKFNIGEEIKLAAVHTRGFDNLWQVNPHMHMLFKKNARLGKGFMYLKQAVTDIIKNKKLNITPSFMQKENKINKGFKRVLNARGWAVRQNRNINIKTLKNFEEDVITYLNKTNNLEYAIKQYILFRVNFSSYFYPIALEEEILNKLLEAKENLRNKADTKLTKFVKKDAKYYYPNSLILKFFTLNENELNAKLFNTEKYFFPFTQNYTLKQNSKLREAINFILETQETNDDDVERIIEVINDDSDKDEKIDRIKAILRFKVINPGVEDYLAELIIKKAFFYNEIMNKHNKGRFTDNMKQTKEKLSKDSVLRDTLSTIRTLFKDKDGYNEFLYFLIKKIKEDEYFSKSELINMFYDEFEYLVEDFDEAIQTIETMVNGRVLNKLKMELYDVDEYTPLSKKEIEAIKERREIAEARRRYQEENSNSKGFGR